MPAVISHRKRAMPKSVAEQVKILLQAADTYGSSVLFANEIIFTGCLEGADEASLPLFMGYLEE